MKTRTTYVVGGVRIPFMKSMTAYRDVTVILPYLMAGFGRIKTHQRWLSRLDVFNSDIFLCGPRLGYLTGKL